MRRLRLVSLLAVALALSGATAGPSRLVESTRLVASIARPDDAPERRAEQRVSRAGRVPTVTSVSALPSAPAPVRSLTLPHALFQRPPPTKLRTQDTSQLQA
jgi:hypothetical protein